MKTALGVVAGLATWVLLVAAGGVVMRTAWPEYAAVAESMTFTLPMLFARLGIGAVALLIAARVTTLIAPKVTMATVVLGALLLAAFIPIHIGLWSKFPLWYHLTFLSTLIPLSLLGGRIALKPANQGR